MDVLVVGGGYTGLSAAYHLFKKGLDVVLLEARRRVGGRTLECIVSGNQRLELGGQYIAPVQERVTGLVKELGLETFPAWGSGDHFLSLDNQTARYQSTPAQCLSELLGGANILQSEIESTLGRLAAMYPEVPAACPWKCHQAEEWDAITFQTWLNSNLKNELSKKFFRFMTNQGFSTEPEQISLLQMLWFLKTSHGLPKWALGGAQANRVVGGTQRVAECLAERLKDRIIYGEQVVEIEQDSHGVQVRSLNKVYHTQAVIVCIPPQLVNEIQYTPPLPADMQRAFAAFQTGNSMKVQAVYKSPFWREHGWSGNGLAFDGIPTFTFDNSGPEGNPGVLLGFLAARHATEWNDKHKEERRQAVLQTWAKVFGPEALEPLEYIEMDWMREPFTRGGHGCHFPPGVWCELGQSLGEENLPHFGKIIWAASDLAKDWNGYLEGALFAGEQASREVEELIHYKIGHN